MSEINISNVNPAEFTELKMESEYNYVDLSQKIKHKNSTQLNEKSNLILNQENDNTFDENDNDSVHSFCLSRRPKEKDKDDKISFSTLMFYLLPSFGKMSCLVLLNINSTLYYETLRASLLYISFFVTLTRCLELIVKPLVAHISVLLNSILFDNKFFFALLLLLFNKFLI